MNYITLQPGNGPIWDCVKDAIRIARHLDIGVKFTFNGVYCYARPNSTEDELTEHYNAAWNKPPKSERLKD